MLPALLEYKWCFKTKGVIVEEKQTHICEEGGAHVRISFWHLLMYFEKPKKSDLK